MTQPQSGKTKIFMTPGGKNLHVECRELDRVTNFNFNPNTGLLRFIHPKGEFGLRIDVLRAFEVPMPPQKGDVAHRTCKVTLTPAEGGTPETFEFKEVIKDSWDAANGLLMIYARDRTAGFHLDQVISFQV